MSKKSKKESTRPMVQLPLTIDHGDSEQFQKIAQGLYFVRYIEEAVPGVKVTIYKLTTDEATLCVTPNTRTGEWPELYRFGLNPMSDGVRHSNGRKYKNTFAEFIDELRQKHIVVVDDTESSSEEDVQGLEP